MIVHLVVKMSKRNIIHCIYQLYLFAAPSRPQKNPACAGLIWHGGEGGIARKRTCALAPPAGQRRCATWPDCCAISRTRRGFSPALTYKKAQRCWAILIGGERGIRTLDTLLTYTHFPGVLLKPLGHLS